MECIRAGAQDFLLKSEVTESRLQRVILQSQARFELEQKLQNSYQEAKKLAELDVLTGLANRYAFEEALSLNITQQPRHDEKLALILFDLDNFKYVNDTHGHNIGDQLLKQVANSVRACLRGNEIFARLGGDEFAIILNNLRTLDNATRVTKRILNSIDKTCNVAGIDIKISASIGIAIYPDNSVNGQELLKYADIAMYRAKKLGRNQICYFAEEMQAKFIERYQIEANLLGALKRNEFVLHYQPVYPTDGKQVIGFEALIRWNFQNTLLFPDSFIEIAECSRVIFELGRWVITQAIAQVAYWNAKHNKTLSVSINLSALQLSDSSLIDFIKTVIDTYQFPARLIEFELTETALLEHDNQSIAFMSELNKLGCRIALDDFGSGFSSVAHLQNFPIDTVKLDQSLMFVCHETKTLALIKGLAAMLHSLDLNIVAEGIENTESMLLCQQLNIQRMQGYYFSKPLDVKTIEAKVL
ncbi:response regulator receiver modulated diguanylate cyclase/phosphodiesterase [Colwellia chukchiensis]|uniref:Response regulator receiver modulated diguanylate cyclase/phosphodiesterase n=1 Tax=Colwellia chukchiensis TaxID=641665 RepID=A0A1H7NV67_9GAMM|nr:EAL domain-containing protein [Colwellia chukchiensis]SEL27204.1 response regulator receiver modulated diguanylate cyclase/phosphodiesterase [Colwellia chukchiensis]